MATLEFLLAAFLDPVQAALVLVIVLVYRGPLTILVPAVLAAVVTETIMVLAAADYAWGEFLSARLVSSLMQAAVLYRAVKLLWPGRAATAQQGAEAHSPRASRLAPWHMRAFVRRRFARLR